jgi:hypothetical protein
MADPDKEDEVDKIKGPRDGMPHSGFTQPPNVLPAEGEDGPENNGREENCHEPERPSRFGQRGQDGGVFLRSGLAIRHTIPLP